jgi:hypothetical protein
MADSISGKSASRCGTTAPGWTTGFQYFRRCFNIGP